MIRYILLLVLMASGLFAETKYFIASKSTTSTTLETVTVQQPATNSKDVSFLAGYAYCSAACTITLSVGGTAATATTLAPVSLTQPVATTTTTAFSGSNVGSGTTVAVYDLAAGGSISLDLARMGMTGNNTARNLTLKASGSSGTYRLAITWGE